MLYLNLLYLLIPILLIFCILGLYLYVNIRKKQLSEYFEKHQTDNSPLTNQIYTNELRSLSLVKNSQKTEEIKDTAATFVWEIDKLKRKNYNSAIEGKKKLNKYQIFASNKLYVGILENEKKIDELSGKFFETVGVVLENIKVVRKEIVFYKNGLRELKNKINNDDFEIPNSKSQKIIFDEFSKTEIQLKELDDLVNSNEIKKAIVEFASVKKKFLNIIHFANKCEELEKIIFWEIPKFFIRLNEVFEQAKKNTNCSLSYIFFDKKIASMKLEHDLIISIFNLENLKEVEEKTNTILLHLFNLNNEVNSEMLSYTFMLKNKEKLNKYMKNISKLFIEIKNNFITAYQIDKIYFSPFKEEISKLSNYLTETNILIDKIKNDEVNYEISFISKQFKYKSLFYQIKGFYFLYIELNKKLEIFYLEGESNLLKFERLVMLVKKMNSYVKNNYIILSKTEIENGLEIENVRQKMINIILNTPSGENPNILNEYNELLTLVNKFVLSVGLKIELSKIFMEVTKTLAPKRSSDIKLNENILLSENSYLEGNYSDALNNVINFLNKGLN